MKEDFELNEVRDIYFPSNSLVGKTVNFNDLLDNNLYDIALFNSRRLIILDEGLNKSVLMKLIKENIFDDDRIYYSIHTLKEKNKLNEDKLSYILA
jgi:hypothetical protein